MSGFKDTKVSVRTSGAGKSYSESCKVIIIIPFHLGIYKHTYCHSEKSNISYSMQTSDGTSQYFFPFPRLLIKDPFTPPPISHLTYSVQA